MTNTLELERIKKTYGNYANCLINDKIVRIDEVEGFGCCSDKNLKVEYIGTHDNNTYISLVFRITKEDAIRYEFLDFNESFYLTGLVQRNFSKKDTAKWNKKIMDFVSCQLLESIKQNPYIK